MVSQKKKVTIKDVAKEAGVSYATVSRALSGSTEIGEETRHRILKICDDMGYSPNSLARSMVSKKTNTIGVIVPSIENDYMSGIVSSLELNLKKQGYNIMVCNSMYDLDVEREAFRLLISKQVDGLVIIPTGTETYSSLKPLIESIPIVFIGENLKNIPENYVSINNYEGGKMGTEYLYSLGHRNILYMGCRKNSLTHERRIQGYLDACGELGIKVKHIDSTYGRSSVEAGYATAKHVFDKSLNFTAIFCAADSFAIGVMKAADEAGIRIPEDISIIGFDNLPFTGLPRIDLTTIDQSKNELAKSAVEILVGIIEKRNNGYVHRVLEPSLVERSSCNKI